MGSFNCVRNRGFTLIELMLSLAVIIILAGITAPVYVSFQRRNDLDIAAETIAQTERRAQILARASDGESSWGVAVEEGSITLFRGSTFDSRDPSFDEIFDMPTSISVSGTSEVVFAAFTGFPYEAGEIVLTPPNGEVRTIVTNEKGTITY